MKSNMTVWAIALGVAAAVLAPVLELATGSELPYLLVLTVLAGAAWGIFRLRRDEMGWRWGGARGHLVAFLYPLLAVGVLALVALIAGEVTLQTADNAKYARRIGLMLASTWVGVLITEEGFFRGALWGVCARAGWSKGKTLAWTSVAFVGWHVAVPLIEADFLLPAAQLPIYYANVILLGLAWGALRLATGSLLVPCTAHASWNAIVYIFYGYGQKTGWLGIERVGVFGPERGVLGLIVNATVAWLLVRWAFRRAR